MGVAVAIVSVGADGRASKVRGGHDRLKTRPETGDSRMSI